MAIKNLIRQCGTNKNEAKRQYFPGHGVPAGSEALFTMKARLTFFRIHAQVWLPVSECRAVAGVVAA